MNAAELLSYFTQVVFAAIFLVVLRRAVRQPRVVNFLAALFFGVAGFLVALGVIVDLLGIDDEGVALGIVRGALLLSWPYPLLRLLDQFVGVRPLVLRVVEVGLVASILTLILSRGEIPDPAVVAMVALFVGTFGYAAFGFVRAARITRGVPGRRLRAAAWGSGFIGLMLIWAIPSGADPGGPWGSFASLSSMASGISYFIAFAPPRILRDAWQTPDLRRLITETALVTPTGDGNLPLLLRALEESVGQVIGAPTQIGLVDEETGEMASPVHTDVEGIVDQRTTIAHRSYATQQPIFEDNPIERDPVNAEAYRSVGARGVIVAPITLGDRRMGIIAAILERPPLFADDDLVLLATLADHAAVILRNHELLVEAADAAAQKAALQLKDEFLTAAAHDLKTPLTTLLAQSQLMRRSAVRNPSTPMNLEGIDRMLSEAQRMRRLVEGLLEASRAEQGGFISSTRPVDLLRLAQDCAAAFGEQGSRIVVQGEPVVAEADHKRIAQVVENLLENALKYSPGGGTVDLRVGLDGEHACVSVSDSGIGIAQADIPVIFERFRRGSAVDDRRFSGMGLGLYLCKRIIDEHGGTISVTTEPGVGSTFKVSLPRQQPESGVLE